jgi:tRNA pseudouridine13 synthase
MLHIEKEGLTTRQVFEFIKGPMHINEAHIGVAGLKDKHARTRQWVSIPARHAQRVVQLEDIGVKVLESGLHQNKLRVGHLKGNRFKILVRHIEGDEARARMVFEQLQTLGVPNYYGPQRFGLGGQNPVKGYELVTKGKGRNGAWLKRFLISSLQSLLFNDWLALRLERGLYDKVIQGDIAKKHDSGGEFEVLEATVETPRAERLEISATGALYGKKHREAQGQARAIEDEILARYELERGQFAARRGDRRMLRFPLAEWAVEAVQEGLWVEFLLPKGAYATAVLREVMKKNPEGVEAVGTQDDIED